MSYIKADFPGLSNEKFTSFVQSVLIQEAKLAPTIMDLTSQVQDGDDRVSIPRMGRFSVQDKVEGTCLTPQKRTHTKDTLDLDLHKAIAFCVEKKARKQTVVAGDFISGVQDALRELALDMDVQIYGQLKLAAAANQVAAIDNTNFLSARGDIVKLRQALNSMDVPASDRFLLVGSDHEANMLGIDEFVHADKYGARESLLNGEIGRLFGATVIMSNVATGDTPVLYHKSSVAFARQILPEVETDYDVLCKRWDIAIDHLFGVEVLDGGERNAILV